MQEILNIFTGVGLLITIVGGVLSAVFFGMSGILFMMAAGDPQKQSMARNAFIGTLVGLCIVGLAGVIPRIVSNLVIEPAGGTPVRITGVSNCDEYLQNQIEVQLTANNYSRVQALVQRIQVQREECGPDLWSPLVFNSNIDTTSGSDGNKVWDGCFETSYTPYRIGSAYGEYLPADLVRTGSPRAALKTTRGTQGNVIVYFDPKPSSLPSNGSVCWVYLKSRDLWVYGNAPG